MLDGSGVQITSGEELAEIVRRGAEAGFPVAVHAIGDRANREALDAFEQTRDVVGSRSACASGSSMRSCSRRRTCRASPSSASPRRCSSRTRRPTATSPTGTGPARPTAPTPTARCVTRARSSRTAPTRRSRSSTRSPASARACGGRSTSATRGIRSEALTVQQAFEATSRRAGVARGRRAPPRPAAPGLRRRSRRARPRPVGRPRRARSWRRWSPAAGCTTRRPGTERALARLGAQRPRPTAVVSRRRAAVATALPRTPTRVGPARCPREQRYRAAAASCQFVAMLHASPDDLRRLTSAHSP